ncbi:565c32ec-a553-4375-9b89-b8b4fcc50cd5 [Sclerotinia trifoliorum]|uniref:565c32ec-a553-4375-9b89-b8b4fcc50cd5 n=1 Tax=Sclerotinia trifoliorum TaxID=28548 RepID=A0A8H2ZTD3_9HELO|nr:565c32ec-a553-4375-9b89-b8b4fcc50cd5 [Sclerotinia trifoliorum]
MADIAKPTSATKADEGAKKEVQSRPVKPDEAVFKAKLAQAEKEHKQSVEKAAAAKAKLDVAQPNKNKDSPAAKHRSNLISQLKEIKEQQGAGKAGRLQVFDQIKKLDEQIKAKVNEQKVAKGKVGFKNVDELDREIDRLQKQVDAATMKIVDERKTLTEISNLRKQRKGFAGFDDTEKSIEALKTKRKNLQDTLDDPESKALSEKYSKLQGELDILKAEQDDAFKNFGALKAEKDKFQAEQQEKWNALRQIKDEHYQAVRAANSYDFNQRQKARERQKAEYEKQQNERKKERAQKMLEEASDPAYLDEIRNAESVLRYLDPTFTTTKAPLQAPSGLEAAAGRTVDDSGLKGTRVLKKEDREEDFMKGTGGKKGKKGNKRNAAAASTPASAKYSCPPAVMEDLAKMGIDPPFSAADVPAVTEKVKAKLTHWKEDQAVQTKRNIEKAQKEVERLDAEESGTATPASEIPATNGHGHGETKATAGADEGGSVANEVELIKEGEKDAAADLSGAAKEDAEES